MRVNGRLTLKETETVPDALHYLVTSTICFTQCPTPPRSPQDLLRVCYPAVRSLASAFPSLRALADQLHPDPPPPSPGPQQAVQIMVATNGSDSGAQGDGADGGGGAGSGTAEEWGGGVSAGAVGRWEGKRGVCGRVGWRCRVWGVGVGSGAEGGLGIRAQRCACGSGARGIGYLGQSESA